MAELLDKASQHKFLIVGPSTAGISFLKLPDQVSDPHFTDGCFTFFCNDWRKGKILRMEIDGDYHFSGEVVGEGCEGDLR